MLIIPLIQSGQLIYSISKEYKTNKDDIKFIVSEEKKDKLEDEKMSKAPEQKKNDIFKSLFDPKSQEDCDIAMYTGCTATVCLIDEKKAYFVNAGDSRIVICIFIRFKETN